MTGSTLTPEVERSIVAWVRRGAGVYVAAQAAGVTRKRFQQWLQRGQKSARSRYRPLWLGVCEARAQARIAAEMAVRDKDVKFWLSYSVGKGAAGRSGRKPLRDGAAMAELLRCLTPLLPELEPFPEARQVMVRFMEAGKPRPETDQQE